MADDSRFASYRDRLWLALFRAKVPRDVRNIIRHLFKRLWFIDDGVFR